MQELAFVDTGHHRPSDRCGGITEQATHLAWEFDRYQFDVGRGDRVAGAERARSDQDVDAVVRRGVRVREECAHGGDRHEETADDGTARGEPDPPLHPPALALAAVRLLPPDHRRHHSSFRLATRDSCVSRR